ncbi:OmpL47-type beta-barrel domain-containing protein, partial [Nanoarchaeota archaeon]
MRKTLLLLTFVLLAIICTPALAKQSGAMLDEVAIYNEKLYAELDFNIVIESEISESYITDNLNIEIKLYDGSQEIYSQQKQMENISTSGTHTANFAYDLSQFSSPSIKINYLNTNTIIETNSIDISNIDEFDNDDYYYITFNADNEARPIKKYTGRLNLNSNDMEIMATHKTTFYMDSIAVEDNDDRDRDCSSDWTYVFEEDDYPEDRSIFPVYIGSIPSNKVITSATAHIWLREIASDDNSIEPDGEDFRCYVGTGSDDSSCDSCMDWDDAFDSNECNIDSGDSLFFSDDYVDELDYEDYELDTDDLGRSSIVLGKVRDAYTSTRKYLYFWCKIDKDNDGAGDGSIYGEDSNRYAPYLNVTYKDIECTTGACCDYWGLYQSTSIMCQDNAGSTQYSCNGNVGVRAADIMVRNQDKYCSGTSSSCTGSLVWDSWTVHSDCSNSQICEEGHTTCTNVACFANSDCGTDDWVANTAYCANNDHYQNYRTYSCSSAGTASASCNTPQDTSQLRYDCGDTTYDAWGANYCQNNNIVHTRTVHNRGCLNGACYNTPQQQTQVVQYCPYNSCSAQGGVHCVLPACYNDGNCPPDQYLNYFCDGNGDVSQSVRDYSCQNPNTLSAACVYTDTSRVTSNCQYGCLSSPTPQCDPNGPPVIVSLTSSSPTVQRTNSVNIDCKAHDPTDHPSTLTPTIQYKSSSSNNWITMSHTNQGISFGVITYRATFTPAYNSNKGNYDFRCQVVDPGNKNSGWIIQANLVNVQDFPSQFTNPVADHTIQSAPAIVGEYINFTTNIYDPDSWLKLLICDNTGASGTSCNTQTYCTDGFKTQGAFRCVKSSNNLNSGSYPWTSYLIEDRVSQKIMHTGATGQFYVANEPQNPFVYLGTSPIWSHTGWYGSTNTLDFKDEIVNYINNTCTPDSQGNCLVPLTVSSDTAGVMKLSQLRIFYALYQNYPPQIHHVYDITVNEGDTVRIDPESFDPNGDLVTFTISNPVGNDGVWQTTESDDGDYQVTVTASDGLVNSTKTINVKVLELLDPESGGNLSFRNVNIHVPQGSLPSQYVAIDVSEMDETDYIQENNLKIAGKVYRFEPSGIVFDPPLQVEIQYNESEVDNENDLDAFLYKLINPQLQLYRWIALGAQVDTTNNILKFNLTHFSDYSIQEIKDDDEAPMLSIFSPEPTIYWHDSGIIPITYDVYDLRDFDLNITITLDSSPYTNNFIDIGELSAGQHTLTIKAEDDYNNINSSSVTFGVFDFTAPITIDNAPTGWQNSDVVVTLTPSDETSISDVHYCVDQFDTCLPQEKGTSITITDEGNNYLRYYSIDTLGNFEIIKSAKVMIDKTKPETTDDAKISWDLGDTPITLTPADSLSGIVQTHYRIDNSAWQTGTEISINQSGTYSIEYYSTDVAGNIETTKSITAYIDLDAPVTTTNADTNWHRDDQEIELYCSDPDSGCDKTISCVVYKDDPGCAMSTLDSVTVSCTEDEACINTILYYSTDIAGHTETMNEAKVHIDKKDPIITAITPAHNGVYSHTQTIKVSVAVEEDSGVASISGNIEGTPVTNGSLFSLPPLGIGRQEFTATVVDNMGNSNTETFYFNTANIPPQVISYDPPLNYNMDEDKNVTFNVIAQDPDSDPINYEWYVDSVRQPEPSPSFFYTTDYEDSGTRNITLILRDLYNSTTHTWLISVNNVNRPVTLGHIANMVENEGELIQIPATATDPDNENSVDNDDNVLVYSYSQFFNSNREWIPGYQDSGDYTITAYVTDGQFTDSQNFNITINHVFVPCYRDYDCGGDRYGQNYCSGNTVLAQKNAFKCLNPGVSQSYCVLDTTTTQTMETCGQGEICSEGECKGVPCYANSDCGTDGYVTDNYCYQNNIVKDKRTYICNNPGTAIAFCS